MQGLRENFTEITHFIIFLGKGERDRIKQLYVVNKSNQTIDTYMKRKQIEDKISKYNAKYSKKAHKLIIYKNKIYKTLRNDSI